ncbi:MAG TPA: glycerophosphoryl diester phosphodiesterase membrane domain-containing protein [Ktedonobacteraceae bacterium]|nr:glycerophosphoryl diester phosphodiesterase membrane domain-containing protein [Ktedonobacteraceae bacterium]
MYEAATRQVSVDPIISRLRPRTVAEILDQAFRLYRKHFLTFVAIIAVVHVPLQLATQIISALLLGNLTSYESNAFSGNFSGNSFSSATTNSLFSYLGVFYAATVVLALLYGLLLSLSQGALTAEIANSHLDKPVSFSDGYRQMFSRLGSLLGVIFLELGIGIVVFIPIILLFVLALGIGLNSAFSSGGGSSSAGSGAFIGLICFSCFLIIPAFLLFAYVFVRFYVVTPVIMVERLGPVQALRRSWELIRNYWWRTFGLLVVLAILGYIVQLGPTALVQAIITIFLPRDFVVQQLISGVITVFTTLIFIPIQLTAVTLYYFDLRVRKEGFDLETAVSQRYAMAPGLPPAWAGAGAGYGQGGPGPATPIMPPPSLGQGQSYGYGYGSYDQYGQQYGQGMPTQPVEEVPRASADTGPLPPEDAPASSET